MYGKVREQLDFCFVTVRKGKKDFHSSYLVLDSQCSDQCHLFSLYKSMQKVY